MTAFPKRSRRLAGAVLACVLAFSAAAAAAAPVTPGRLLADYTHTRWNGLQGAPRDVLKFAQTADGWLWMATPAGLYRFDGIAFERMDSVQGHHLLSSNVLGLLAASGGRFFVGYRFGGISLFANGAVRHFGEAEGLPGGIVMSITEGPDGSVWAATGGGLALLQKGAVRFTRLGPDSGLPQGVARQVLFSQSGRLWVSVAGGIYYRDPGQQRFTRSWPLVDLMGMAESPDGTLWAGDGVSRYYRVYAAPPPGQAAARPELDGNGMFFDRDGTMWLLKSHGLERRRGDWRAAPGIGQQLTTENGISGPLPQTHFQDREGNLWFGTSTGLDRLRRNRVQTLPVAAPFDHPAMAPLPDGGMLIGDMSSPRTHSATSQGLLRQVPGHGFSASHTGPDGALWLADRQRIRRMEGGREAWSMAPPTPGLGAPPQALVLDVRGRPWLSVARDGLYRLEDGAWRRNGGLAALPSETGMLAMALAADGLGNVWAGYLRNRIARIDREDGVRIFGDADGLELGNVLALRVDGPRVWAGGEFGLALFHGNNTVTHITGEGGKPFRGVSGIVRTASGELWLHGADGATRIAAADVARLLREPQWPVPFERFDGLDGLLGGAEQIRPLPSLAQDRDGRLWFASASDIATLDPAAIPRNRTAPPVQIRYVQSDGRTYLPVPQPAGDGGPPATADTASAAPHEVILPKGSNDLQLAFTALSLAMPERVRFRYRLEGVDRAWQEAGNRRAAFYTNLPPGSYRFVVTAANEDLVWNSEGASVRITIPPLFTQTPWFIALLVLLGALALGGLYALRIRRMEARMHDRLQVRLRERARIARGLHDTLLQSVQSLIMFFDRQAQALPCDAQERKKIEQTLELADQLMIEGRDYIMELRSGDAPGDLAAALAEYGSVLLHERLHASVQGNPRALQPHVHGEVHAIAREALFNAARHAQAGSIELVLEYGAGCFTLRIHDDGRGLAHDVVRAHARPGHFGLPGMRERAAAIGADFSVDSMPGKGTAIRLSLVAQLAYVERRGAWLGRLLPGWGRGRNAAASCGIEK